MHMQAIHKAAAKELIENAEGKGAVVQKDRFLFAIIIYGLILLVGAGVCCALLPGDISAVVNAGAEAGKEITPTPEGIVPTPTIVPTREPEQSTGDIHGNSDEAENQKLTEQGKTDGKQPGEAVSDGDVPDETEPEVEPLTGAWALLSAKTTAEWRNIIGDRCIVLQKPERAVDGQALVLSLTEMPVEQSIALRIQGCEYTGYGYDTVERIVGEQYFVSEPLLTENELNEDPLRRMTASCTLQEEGSHELYVELLLDKTYVYNVYATKTHYFISLKEAKEVYDRVVVLDAGHGGWDTGTPSKDGKLLEKNINLQVLLYLEELLAAENIKVYATRTTDRYIGHAERIAVANALEADLFLSIHCNNAYQDAGAEGTEVLYSQYGAAENKLNSEKLAQLCQEELAVALQLEDCGLQARGDELTVLQRAEVPAVQVELAFMSEAEEMNVLKTDEAQKKAAEALYKAVLRAYEEMTAE